MMTELRAWKALYNHYLSKGPKSGMCFECRNLYLTGQISYETLEKMLLRIDKYRQMNNIRRMYFWSLTKKGHAKRRKFIRDVIKESSQS